MPRGLRSFEELHHDLLKDRGGKFLGVFLRGHLVSLERLLLTDLGAHNPNKRRRPFIGAYKTSEKCRCLKIVFLSSQNYSRRPVDLSHCDRGNQLECVSLIAACYLFRDRYRDEVLAYSVPEERLRDLGIDFVLCGKCKNLEFLDRLKEVVIEPKGKTFRIA